MKRKTTGSRPETSEGPTKREIAVQVICTIKGTVIIRWSVLGLSKNERKGCKSKSLEFFTPAGIAQFSYLTITSKCTFSWHFSKRFVGTIYYALSSKHPSDPTQNIVLGVTTSCHFDMDTQKLLLFCEQQQKRCLCQVGFKVQAIAIDSKGWKCSSEVDVKLTKESLAFLPIHAQCIPKTVTERTSYCNPNPYIVDKELCDCDLAIVFMLVRSPHSDRDYDMYLTPFGHSKTKFQSCKNDNHENDFLYTVLWHADFAHVLDHYFNVEMEIKQEARVLCDDVVQLEHENSVPFCFKETFEKKESRTYKLENKIATKTSIRGSEPQKRTACSLIRVLSCIEYRWVNNFGFCGPKAEKYFAGMFKYLMDAVNLTLSGEQVIRCIEYLWFEFWANDSSCTDLVTKLVDEYWSTLCKKGRRFSKRKQEEKEMLLEPAQEEDGNDNGNGNDNDNNNDNNNNNNNDNDNDNSNKKAKKNQTKKKKESKSTECHCIGLM
ncbi:hypothetical protein RFI_11404 [Reticulomyxa filosa]|uniref:Uncharacterized protein n=1 Tax=Reticulomyxa filosa TaxID=46433 RepID=X6NK46_RETFI|nr:hypothetical protein RFI_11404 [Reticulomyxa filosa]|eukprot:ETO25732.1 hypothetical protein RFI_11404 [Reticulomyxa filosa]